MRITEIRDGHGNLIDSRGSIVESYGPDADIIIELTEGDDDDGWEDVDVDDLEEDGFEDVDDDELEEG